MLDPLDHPADDGDIAVELARGVADRGVKLAAGAGIGRHVAANPDRAVAMGQADAAVGIARDRPAVGETGASRIRIGRAERGDGQALGAAPIFMRRMRDRARG